MSSPSEHQKGLFGRAFRLSVFTVEGWSSPSSQYLSKGLSMLVVAILMV